jgi:hypothetical protein
MESVALFEEKIAIQPRDMSRGAFNIEELLTKKMAGKLEGKCSLHGYVVPGTLKLISRSVGYVEKGRYTGDFVYHVQAEGQVIYPPDGTKLEGVVRRKNKMGMFVDYKDAIQIILPRDIHLSNEEFDQVKVNEIVEVEIKKSRFQVNDDHILSVGLFLRSTGRVYTEQEEKGRREGVVPPLPPGFVPPLPPGPPPSGTPQFFNPFFTPEFQQMLLAGLLQGAQPTGEAPPLPPPVKKTVELRANAAEWKPPASSAVTMGTDKKDVLQGLKRVFDSLSADGKTVRDLPRTVKNDVQTFTMPIDLPEEALRTLNSEFKDLRFTRDGIQMKNSTYSDDMMKLSKLFDDYAV